MKRPRSAQVDLNLLTVFAAIHRERSITRAGRALYMSQSAVSHALGRLREVFGDPLFVRTAEGMQPTALANRLAEPVQDALRTVDDVLSTQCDFDPKTADLRLTIGTVGAQPFAFLPAMYQRLEAEAPGVSLHVKYVDQSELAAQLDSGAIDLGVGPAPKAESPASARLVSAPLIDDPLVSVTWKGNEEVGPELDIATYARLPHLVIATSLVERTWIDDALAAHGLQRRIAAIMPDAQALPLVLPGTRLVCTVMRSIASPFLGIAPLRVSIPPIPGPPHVAHLVWHVRSNRDPAQRWARALLQDVCAAARAEFGESAKRRSFA